jgi:hypothetical protein
MDVDKLFKAIQILVQEEVKKQLPTVVKEVVKREMGTLLKENVNTVKSDKVKKTSVSPKLSISDAILGDNTSVKKHNKVNLTKNPILNEVLAQTRPFTSQERTGHTSVLDGLESIKESYKSSPETDGYEEWPTMNNPLSSAIPEIPTSPSTFNRAEIAAKIGYGDMASTPSPNGLGVKTGLAGLDRVLNRDNRELIRAMDKHKNFRPGT